MTTKAPRWGRAILLGALLIGGSLLVSAVIVGPRGFGTIVTLSLDAKTEALALELKPNREYAWRVPPGSYSVIDEIDNPNCAGQPPNVLCTLSARTTLQLSGAPELTLELTPDERFTVTVAPALGQEMNVRVLGESGEIMATSNLLAFQSEPVTRDIRLPMILEQATIGALLYESSADIAPYDDDWQPILREGEFRAFANVGAERERYQLLDGRLDSGDVATIRSRSDADTNENAAVWGHVTITPARDDQPAVLRTILHTPFPELLVRRFGAAEGYVVKIPRWRVISTLPWWQAAWVTFVSLMLLFQVGVQATELFAKTSWCRDEARDEADAAATDTAPTESAASPTETGTRNKESRTAEFAGAVDSAKPVERRMTGA